MQTPIMLRRGSCHKDYPGGFSTCRAFVSLTKVKMIEASELGCMPQWKLGFVRRKVEADGKPTECPAL
jgi:hypothetical protein